MVVDPETTPETDQTWWERFPDLHYGIAQLEKPSVTGMAEPKHLISYLEFNRPKTYKDLERRLPPKAYVMKRTTLSRQSAKEFCSKRHRRDRGPWQYGNWNEPYRLYTQVKRDYKAPKNE